MSSILGERLKVLTFGEAHGPAMGCVVDHLLRTAQDKAPIFVDLMQGRPLARNSARVNF